MKRILVGVVEDEMIIASSIITTLESLGYNTVGPALNYTQGVEMLQNEKPDILLLDIILAGKKDGIDLAWKIREEFDIPFIFLTSHADKGTIERVKQVEPPAYLVKPFNKDELYGAIEIALYNYSNKKLAEKIPTSNDPNYLMKDSLFVKVKGSYVKIPYTDVMYLKNDNIYIEIVTAKSKYLVRSNMNEYLQKFPSNFIRVHRSYAVNTDYLDAIGSDFVTIKSQQIPLSRNFKDELLAQINIG